MTTPLSAHHPSPLMPERGDGSPSRTVAVPSALAPNVITVSATSTGLRVGGFYSQVTQHAADLCRPDAEAPAAFAGRLLNIRPIDGLACHPMRLSGVWRMGARALG